MCFMGFATPLHIARMRRAVCHATIGDFLVISEVKYNFVMTLNLNIRTGRRSGFTSAGRCLYARI